MAVVHGGRSGRILMAWAEGQRLVTHLVGIESVWLKLRGINEKRSIYVLADC